MKNTFSPQAFQSVYGSLFFELRLEDHEDMAMQSVSVMSWARSAWVAAMSRTPQANPFLLIISQERGNTAALLGAQNWKKQKNKTKKQNKKKERKKKKRKKKSAATSVA